MYSKTPINSKVLLNGMKKDLPQVKILEPFSPEVIECETTDDFNEVFNANPEVYSAMTTQKLNKIFKIPGYRITKIKGVVCLRSIKPCEQQHPHDEMEIINEEIKNIKQAFNQLSEQFEMIKKYLIPQE